MERHLGRVSYGTDTAFGQLAQQGVRKPSAFKPSALSSGRVTREKLRGRSDGDYGGQVPPLATQVPKLSQQKVLAGQMSPSEQEPEPSTGIASVNPSVEPSSGGRSASGPSASCMDASGVEP